MPIRRRGLVRFAWSAATMRKKRSTCNTLDAIVNTCFTRHLMVARLCFQWCFAGGPVSSRVGNDASAPCNRSLLFSCDHRSSLRSIYRGRASRRSPHGNSNAGVRSLDSHDRLHCRYPVLGAENFAQMRIRPNAPGPSDRATSPQSGRRQSFYLVTDPLATIAQGTLSMTMETAVTTDKALGQGGDPAS
jgi:hypothetical protein